MLLFSLPRAFLKRELKKKERVIVQRHFYGFINQENTKSLETIIRFRALPLDKAMAQSTRRGGDWWSVREKEEGSGEREEKKEERKRKGENIETLVWQVIE